MKIVAIKCSADSFLLPLDAFVDLVCWLADVIFQDDLVGMRRELESEAKQLQQDRGKQERLATTITNQMQADAQVNNNDLCDSWAFTPNTLTGKGFWM